jgi:hypothetical protein
VLLNRPSATRNPHLLLPNTSWRVHYLTVWARVCEQQAVLTKALWQRCPGCARGDGDYLQHREAGGSLEPLPSGLHPEPWTGGARSKRSLDGTETRFFDAADTHCGHHPAALQDLRAELGTKTCALLLLSFHHPLSLRSSFKCCRSSYISTSLEQRRLALILLSHLLIHHLYHHVVLQLLPVCFWAEDGTTHERATTDTSSRCTVGSATSCVRSLQRCPIVLQE